MDVGDWLQSLGLGRYEATFRDNEIDNEILPTLTAEDLKELGVTILGHRRKMLTAIAALFAWSASPAPVAQPTNPGPGPLATDAAERRQLTVMFCDLVGSTAMSARLDPEDMREIIGSHHKCCSTVITGNGGFVAKYMGDGVLAYFGYPQAHEHDAERAVQAGLAIVEAAPKLVTAAGSPLHVRVGIATGLVVVGDLIGSGEAQERGVVGETPNLAARLQAIAEPDTVVIAESTRRLLGNLFELQDLGTKDLKGIASPARTWAAMRPSAAESRFEAFHATDLTTLVGRDEEFELLLRRWSRAKTGEGQVVLLSGEAGIGKSRLTAALLERLAGEPHTRLRYFCSPQHTDSAFYPIIGQMERAAGLMRDDAPPTKLDKLGALLAPTSTSIEDGALFAEMLSLLNDGRYPALDWTPAQRRQRTFEALVSQVEALTRQSPVLMIFEDAHWTDPTSLEAFGRMVDRIAGLRALLIVTFRPEFQAPWIGRPHVSSPTLNRLAQREIDAMIDRVVGNKLLPADVRRDIVERTDGIPLFVEEMTKAVLEAEGEGEARRTVAAVPSPALAVPASLHASLMALWGKAGQRSLERSALVEAVEQLTRALAQIAALPATPALRREQIKIHVALITPIMHVKGHAAHEAKAAMERARLLIEHAEAVGEPLEDPLLLFSVLYGLWVSNYVAFNGEAIRELATQFLALAEKRRATIPLMIGHRIKGTTLLMLGDFQAGRAHFDQALDLYDPMEHRQLATRFGQDVGVAILSNRSFVRWFLGYPEAALTDTECASKYACEVGQAVTSMYALFHMSFPPYLVRKLLSSKRVYRRSSRIGGR